MGETLLIGVDIWALSYNGNLINGLNFNSEKVNIQQLKSFRRAKWHLIKSVNFIGHLLNELDYILNRADVAKVQL